MRPMKTLASFAIALLLTAAPALAQTWQIDPAHSRASFSVRHFGISNIRGDFGDVSGTIVYDGKDVTKATVNATIKVDSITTRVGPRDTHLKTADFFDAANHPTMTFTSTSITRKPNGKYAMAGNLTMRGTTKAVTFELDPPSAPLVRKGEATRVGAAATGRINRKDFGINYHSVLENGALGVGDEVDVVLDVEMTQQAPAGRSTN
jgi:polyisoprenoid-binding protein YceI